MNFEVSESKNFQMFDGSGNLEFSISFNITKEKAGIAWCSRMQEVLAKELEMTPEIKTDIESVFSSKLSIRNFELHLSWVLKFFCQFLSQKIIYESYRIQTTMIIYTIGISHDIIIIKSQRRFKHTKHHKIL